MPLEPRPPDAGVAAQARGREEHESEQEGRRAAAHELHPPGRDRVGLPQRDERVRRPGQSERGPQAADAALGSGLAVEQAADLPVVQRVGCHRRRPAVGAVERREDGQGRELRHPACHQHRRRAALRLVGAARERAQRHRQRAGGVPDDHQAQARLGDRADRAPARLDHLAPRRDARARQPPRRQPQPPGGVVQRPQLDQPPAQVQLGERKRASGRAGSEPEPVKRRRGRPVDLGVTAGWGRSQPGGGEGALREGELLESRPQAAVGGDGRSSDDASERCGGHRDADRDHSAPARPSARPRRRDPKRRPSRPPSGSHIGANLQRGGMFASRGGGYKRQSASGVFTPRERRAACGRRTSAPRAARTPPPPRRRTPASARSRAGRDATRAPGCAAARRG